MRQLLILLLDCIFGPSLPSGKTLVKNQYHEKFHFNCQITDVVYVNVVLIAFHNICISQEPDVSIEQIEQISLSGNVIILITFNSQNFFPRLRSQKHVSRR